MDNSPPITFRTMTSSKPPELQFGGPVTLSDQIAAWLRQRIAAGDWRPDADPLPSESYLQDAFGVSRPTVRRAIQILRREGLVYTVAQRGTYVRREARAGRASRRNARNIGTAEDEANRRRTGVQFGQLSATACHHRSRTPDFFLHRVEAIHYVRATD